MTNEENYWNDSLSEEVDADVFETERTCFNYKCNHCNTIFLSFADNKITKCIMCNEDDIKCSSSIESVNVFAIAFAKVLNDFINIYKKKIFWNPLVPIKFKRKKIIYSVSKVYLPAFLSNINQKGLIHFIGGEKETKEDKRVETKRYNVVEKVYFDYNDILINTISKLDDKVFQTICDYDFSNLKEVDSSDDLEISYLVKDIDITDVSEKTRERIAKQTISIAAQNVPHSLKKLKADETSITFANTKEVYVPIYLLNVKYKNKLYQCIMNGQNGKFHFDIPIGIIETIIFSLIIFCLVFLISFLIVYFL